MEWTASFWKRGVKVTALLLVFQSPPVEDAT
jgi:hypothetical protein